MSTDVQQRPAAWEGFVGGNWETNFLVRNSLRVSATSIRSALPFSFTVNVSSLKP